MHNLYNLPSMSTERKRYHKDNAPSDEIITLINLVRQNPALYNYKLQPNQRRRADVLNGWAEIAARIGNNYTVEECRRKWKNLRDTYHQYRLRKPKFIEGRLSKWRYAKDLDFLSNVYQPKLKSQRTPCFDTTVQDTLLQIKQQDDEDVMEDDEDVDDDHDHEQSANDSISHSQILVNDDAEAFILTAYEESVNDDVVTTIDQHHSHHHQQQHHQHNHHNVHHHHHHHHQQHQTHHGNAHDHSSIPNIELAHVVDDVVDDIDDDDHVDRDIVKHEHGSSLDDDGATGAEVDYEEVCLYEEADNPTSVDCCEIGVDGSAVFSPNSKSFHYIDTNEFRIGTVTESTTPTRSSQFVSSSSSNNVLTGAGGTKLKNLTLVTTTTQTTNNRHTSGGNCSDTQMLGTAATLVADAADLGTETSSVATTTTVGIDALATTGSGSSGAYATPTILQLPTLSTGGATSLSVTPVSSNTPASTTSTNICVSQNGSTLSAEDIASVQSKRDELDLFFDFLKKKIQCFPKSEITHIQVEFLNCVLRREANKSSKD